MSSALDDARLRQFPQLQLSRGLLFALTMAAFLLAGLVVLANLVDASYGLDNLSMVQAFNLDEARFLVKMKVALEQNTLDPDTFFNYGSLYDTTGFWCIRFLQHFGWLVNTQLAGLVLRFISIGAGLLAYLAMVRLSLISQLPLAISASAALALLAMPDFVAYSGLVHPDTLQTLFVIMSFTCALTRPTYPFALLASLFAGLAFSTKYVGLVVLPFCIVPLALFTLGREGFSREALIRLTIQCIGALATFFGVFAITNPYAIRDLGTFVLTFLFQLRLTATGYGLVEPSNPALWWPPLVQQFGIIGMLYMFGGVLLESGYLFRTVRRSGLRAACLAPDVSREAVMLAYVLLTATHLAIVVHSRESKFSFHIVPLAIVISTVAYWRLITQASGQSARRQWPVGAFASALLVFAGTQIAFDLQPATKFGGAAVLRYAGTQKPTAAPIKFGNSLAMRYPRDIRIIADVYTYLPPHFTNAINTTPLKTEQIEQEQPEVIIINSTATGSRVWKKAGTSIAERKFVRDERYPDTPTFEAIIDRLLSPASGYAVKFETEQFVSFERKR